MATPTAEQNVVESLFQRLADNGVSVEYVQTHGALTIYSGDKVSWTINKANLASADQSFLDVEEGSWLPDETVGAVAPAALAGTDPDAERLSTEEFNLLVSAWTEAARTGAVVGL